jgi:hypothetical protein
MKKHFSLITLVFLATLASAQSDSFLTMKDTFKGGDDVYHFSLSGFLCRTVLAMADEHEFRDAITDIKNIRLIVVPKEHFSAKGLSINGFKKVLKQDAFQELAHFRDHGDLVSVYLQEENNKNRQRDRYFILVEDGDEVVGIEMKGSVDMNVLLNLNKEVAFN